MNLKEAIEHAQQKAIELGDCECAKEHRQLAEWLTELLALKASSSEKKVIDGLVCQNGLDMNVGNFEDFINDVFLKDKSSPRIDIHIKEYESSESDEPEITWEFQAHDLPISPHIINVIREKMNEWERKYKIMNKKENIK